MAHGWRQCRYVTSVYWAMSTMTTVGYGDVTPIQTKEKLIAMAGMIVGVTAFAYVTGSASLLLSTLNAQVWLAPGQEAGLYPLRSLGPTPTLCYSVQLNVQPLSDL